MSKGEAAATRLTTPSDREIVYSRVVAAPRDLVFAAHTDPAHVPNWMLGPAEWSMLVCEIDLRPGGAWHFVWRSSDGAEMGMGGEYREVVPPERLVNTERWGGDWAETLNTLVLTEADGGTIIESRMLYPSKGARDKVLASSMESGLEESYDRLVRYLEALV